MELAWVPETFSLFPNSITMVQDIKSNEARRVVSKRLRDYYRHLEETLVTDPDSYFESLMERARAEQDKRYRRSSLGVR